MSENKIKIGILTFHRAHNYGAMLQAYALLKFFKHKGCNVEIIDFFPIDLAEEYRWIPNYSYYNLKGKIKGLIILLLGLFSILKRRRAYNDFVTKYLQLPLKPKYCNPEQLKDLQYDIVVYGSDQIWRKHPFTHQLNEVYWGKYLTNVKKKIAYAASTNTYNFTAQELNIIKNHLQNFYAIGIREHTFAEFLKNHFNKPITIVCDPVFLIEKQKWLDIALLSNFKVPNRPYILFYHLNPSKEAHNFVNKLSLQKNIMIIEIQGRVNPFKRGKRYLHTASPIDFIKLLVNASLVVTNSFHGTAFSLIFEKQFYVVGLSKASQRIYSLLQVLEISDRVIDKSDDNIGEKILDYKKVNQKLNNMRTASVKFLQQCLDL